MADHFPDTYFPPSYFAGSYFEGGEQNPGAMSANLSGSAAVSAGLVGQQVALLFRPGAYDAYDRNAKEFEEREEANRKALRNAIERALGGEVAKPVLAAPLKAKERAAVVKAVAADVKTDGLVASVTRIERMLKVIEAEALRRQQEEEAIIMLLLAA